MESVFLLSMGFGRGFVWLKATSLGGLNDLYCSNSSVANSTVLLNRVQWISLIHGICISDEWEEWNDSFAGQLFIYLLTLFLEKWKCVMYGILHYWACIYLTREVSKTSIFNKKVTAAEVLHFWIELKKCCCVQLFD